MISFHFRGEVAAKADEVEQIVYADIGKLVLIVICGYLINL